MRITYFLASILLLVFVTVAVSTYTPPNCIEQCATASREAFSSLNDEEIISSCVQECFSSESNEQEEAQAMSESQGVPIDEGKMWEQYRTELVKVLSRGQNKPYLQIVQEPIEAIWHNEDPELLQRLSDYVPYWSPYFTASPYRISQMYTNFILNINAGYRVVDADSKRMLDVYMQEFNGLSEKLSAQRSTCMRQFITLANKPELESYLKTCLKDVQSKIEDAGIMIQFFTARAYGAENDDLQQARVDSKVETTYHEAIGSLKRFADEAKQGRGTRLTFDVDSFTQINKPRSWEEVSRGLVRPSSLNNSFFTFLTSDGKNGMATTSDKFKLSVSFQSYGAISVAPGKWFRHSVVRKFKNGPFIHSQSNLFGDKGLMRLKPSKFYVAYKPTMTLVVDKKDEFKFTGSKVKKSSGIFSSRSESAKITTNAISSDTVKITITSNNPYPLVIAVENELLP